MCIRWRGEELHEEPGEVVGKPGGRGAMQVQFPVEPKLDTLLTAITRCDQQFMFWRCDFLPHSFSVG